MTMPPDKRPNESLVTYQQRLNHTRILERVRDQLMATKPTNAYTDTNLQTARRAGHNEARAQAQNIINAMIEDYNRAIAPHVKPNFRLANTTSH